MTIAAKQKKEKRRNGKVKMAQMGNWMWHEELKGVQRDFLKLLKMWWNWVSDRPCPEMAVHIYTGSKV